ncbi:hypothetical protein C5L34_001785 [Lentilactobacillus hilgardii]|nr:hypothetical protein C5L34_001785 [Lentilactobacillus hilgardii]
MAGNYRLLDVKTGQLITSLKERVFLPYLINYIVLNKRSETKGRFMAFGFTSFVDDSVKGVLKLFKKIIDNLYRLRYLN